MAVLLETSRGDLVVDLYTEECPLASLNFLKLCKIKYYNNCLFQNVQKDFIVQTGDPTGTGRGGLSINGVLYGEQARFFDDEIHPHVRHTKKGLVAMAGAGKDMNASQFYITTGAELDSLDGKHTIFGEVSEGMDVLEQINQAFVDDDGRPLQNVRIRHTIILDDPFPDPAQLADHIPDASPELVREEGGRLEDDWKPDEGDGRTADEIEEETRRHEAENRAVVLEMIGDLPEADAKPPSSMLFICKLNPVTTEEDLEIIFSRFGTITSCDIIRDWKTGDSLCYAFLGFDNDQSCEEAYFKMNNVLIDDRRIKVDFSQSVHHLWKSFRRFGRAGGKDEAAAVGEVEGGGAEAPKRERFEMKSRGHQHGGGRYDLLLDGDDGGPPPSRSGPGGRGTQERRGGPSGHQRNDHRRHDDRRPPADLPGRDRQDGAHEGERYSDRGGGRSRDHGGGRPGERGDADRRDTAGYGDRQREGAGYPVRDVRERSRSRSRDRQRHERDGGSRRGRDAEGSGRDRERGRDVRGREGESRDELRDARRDGRDGYAGERAGLRYGDGEEGREVTGRENGHRHAGRGGEVEEVRDQKKEKKDKKEGKDKHKHKHKEKDKRHD